MTVTTEPAPPHGRRADLDLWVRRGCPLLVAAVAAYASYEHQRGFALRGGADATSAAPWPLSVDGLLVLATVGLLKSGHGSSRRSRIAVWLSFLLGVAVSLAANVAAAPTLAWHSVLVAGWPPVALLLAVELLAHRPRVREHIETDLPAPVAGRENETTPETGLAPTAEVSPTTELPAAPSAEPSTELTAQEIMWAHVLQERIRGRIPTGAELDRVAGTNNYGRTVLRQWREQGRIPPVDRDRRNGHPVAVPGQDGAR